MSLAVGCNLLSGITILVYIGLAAPAGEYMYGVLQYESTNQRFRRFDSARKER